MTNAALPKHVFMSYSRRDEAVMRRVVTFLRKQGINVWVDNEKLVPGTPIWEEEIEKAIISAGAVLVLLSPDSKKSPWVRREISYAEDNGKRIFPIMIAGIESNTIPIRLTTHQRIDIRQNEELGLNSLKTAITYHLDYLEAQERRAREETERLARKVEQEAAEKAAKEKAAREAAEKTAREKAEREAAEKAAKEKAEQETAEKATKEKAEREAAIKEAQEKAEREAAEKAVSEKTEQERKERERLERENKARKEKEAGELHYKGMLAYKQGNLDEAEFLFQQSLKIAIDLKDEQAKTNILNQLATLTQDRLDRKKAEKEAAEKVAKEKVNRESTKKAGYEKNKSETTRNQKQRAAKKYHYSKTVVKDSQFSIKVLIIDTVSGLITVFGLPYSIILLFSGDLSSISFIGFSFIAINIIVGVWFISRSISHIRKNKKR